MRNYMRKYKTVEQVKEAAKDMTHSQLFILGMRMIPNSPLQLAVIEEMGKK